MFPIVSIWRYIIYCLILSVSFLVHVSITISLNSLNLAAATELNHVIEVCFLVYFEEYSETCWCKIPTRGMGISMLQWRYVIVGSSLTTGQIDMHHIAHCSNWALGEEFHTATSSFHDSSISCWVIFASPYFSLTAACFLHPLLSPKWQPTFSSTISTSSFFSIMTKAKALPRSWNWIAQLCQNLCWIATSCMREHHKDIGL